MALQGSAAWTAPTVAASGTTQSTATQVSGNVAVIVSSTAAAAVTGAATSGITLADVSVCNVGFFMVHYVVNTTANPVFIFPGVAAAKIDAAAAGAGITIAANARLTILQVGPLQYYSGL